MKLETLQLNKLNPAEYNPRTITKDEFEGLKTSLKTFGQQENLIVNKDMTIISGHQRYNAMKALGWTEAVCNLVDLDKHEEKKLNVIMNSTAISGKYDELKLAEILEELKLDDNYDSLRLNKLEALDLSDEFEELDPEIKFSEELLEQHNYVVLYFDNEIDWLQLQTLYPLEKKYSGNIDHSQTQKGVGRVVKGADFINKVLEK
jgi:ParB-like chromosome segregation protein Spo0J